MQMKTKIWLILAASLILIGCILLVGVMNMLKWDLSGLGTGKFETKNYTIEEKFSGISIQTNTTDIQFVPSADGKTTVECYEQEKVVHTVTVQDNTLMIKVTDTRKWYERIGIHFTSPRITVSLPQGRYGALAVNTDTGNVEIGKTFFFENINISGHTGQITNFASAANDIEISSTTGSICMKDLTAGSVLLSISTGRIDLSGVTCSGDLSAYVSTGKAAFTNISCQNFISNGSTGDIQLTNVVAENCLSIERSTGDVTLDGCDGGEILIETDTGNVKGSLLSEKVFRASTDTGRVQVPDTVSGGLCRITTDTGDIKITLK